MVAIFFAVGDLFGISEARADKKHDKFLRLGVYKVILCIRENAVSREKIGKGFTSFHKRSSIFPVAVSGTGFTFMFHPN